MTNWRKATREEIADWIAHGTPEGETYRLHYGRGLEVQVLDDDFCIRDGIDGPCVCGTQTGEVGEAQASAPVTDDSTSLEASERGGLRYEAGIILSDGPECDDDGTPSAAYVVADGLVRSLDLLEQAEAERDEWRAKCEQAAAVVERGRALAAEWHRQADSLVPLVGNRDNLRLHAALVGCESDLRRVLTTDDPDPHSWGDVAARTIAEGLGVADVSEVRS